MADLKVSTTIMQRAVLDGAPLHEVLAEAMEMPGDAESRVCSNVAKILAFTRVNSVIRTMLTSNCRGRGRGEQILRFGGSANMSAEFESRNYELSQPENALSAFKWTVLPRSSKSYHSCRR